MKKFALALSLFTSMISTSFAEAISFNNSESPYITIERAFNTAQNFSPEIIKTLATQAKSKVIILNLAIKSNTTLEHLGSASQLYLFKQTVTTAAIPARGPLFPAQPERTNETRVTILCTNANSCMMPAYTGEFSTASTGEISFKFKGQASGYTFRQVGNVIVAKGGNEYLYGWIE